MRNVYRILIVLEVLVCFTPMTMLWSVGAILSPFMLGAPLGDATLDGALGQLWFFGSVLGGGCGLAALVALLTRLLGTPRRVRRPALLVTGLALGVLAVLPLAVGLLPEGGSFATLAPIAATAHLVYLGRGMLFPLRHGADSRDGAAAGTL